MAQKYLSLSEDNLLLIEKVKEERGIKTDSKAINAILEDYRRIRDEQQKQEEFADMVAYKMSEQMNEMLRMIYATAKETEFNTAVLKDIGNVFLLREGVEHGALYDVLPSPYIKMSEANIRKKIGKVKQKKDHRR